MILPVYGSFPGVLVSVSLMVTTWPQAETASAKAVMILDMNVVYLVIVVCALINSIRTGTAQMFPCFAVSLGYLAVLEFFYQPHSPAWLREWYAVAAGGYLLFRALAVAEAFLLDSHGHPRRRLIAVTVVMLSVLCASIMAWQVTGPTVLISAIQARRVVNVGLFAFLLIYVLLRWSMNEWRPCVTGRHVLFQLALQTALIVPSLLAIAGPRTWWGSIDFAAYAVKSGLLVGWAVLSIPGPPHVHATLRSEALADQSHA